MNAMLTNRIAHIAGAGLFLCCSGCNSQELSRSKAKSVIESSRPSLFNAGVTLSNAEVECATREGIFTREAPYSTPKGDALGFHGYLRKKDGDALYRQLTDAPNLSGDQQISVTGGRFGLIVDEITGITDHPQNATKLVTARLRVKIQHVCFPKPLPAFHDLGSMLGPSERLLELTFRKYDDGWRFEY